MRIIFGGKSDIGKVIWGKHLNSTKCDVTCPYTVHNTIDNYEPDEVVNCAGVIHPVGLNTLAYYKEINTNLIGSFNIAAAIDKDTKAVFISSTSGLHGRAGWAGYCASKAGVISLVQSLALEGYQVWCVSPGRVKTKMRKGLFPDEDQSTLLEPSQVSEVVEDCFNGKYEPGSNIIVRKEGNNVQIEVQN